MEEPGLGIGVEVGSNYISGMVLCGDDGGEAEATAELDNGGVGDGGGAVAQRVC